MAIHRPRSLMLLFIAVLTMLSLSARSAGPGRSAVENVDDATITAQVKAKLAAEKISTLTKVDVDTNLRTVTLNGTVPSEDLRQRASNIAWSVKGVNAVVNNLTVRRGGEPG